MTSDILLVTPGERVDVIVTPKGKAGTPLMLRAMLYNRGYGSVQYRGVEDVMTVEFTNQPPLTAAPVRVSREIPKPITKGATPVSVVLTLPPMDNGQSEFRVNGVPFWKAKPFVAKVGETQLWTIKNDSDWDHPFHLHGFFFQMIDEKGEAVRPLAWKDTINIPMKTTARLAFMPPCRPAPIEKIDGRRQNYLLVARPAGVYREVWTLDSSRDLVWSSGHELSVVWCRADPDPPPGRRDRYVPRLPRGVAGSRRVGQDPLARGRARGRSAAPGRPAGSGDFPPAGPTVNVA